MKWIKYIIIVLLTLYSVNYIYGSFFPAEDSFESVIGSYFFFTVPVAVALICLSAWGFYKSNFYLKLLSALGMFIGFVMLVHEPILAMLGIIDFSQFR
jgi:hypothetical protein